MSPKIENQYFITNSVAKETLVEPLNVSHNIQPHFEISAATIRNWKRLNTEFTGRLTTRANKRKSEKRILPIEYFTNKDNIAFVQSIMDYIDVNNLRIDCAILSLGINLLKQSKIYEKQHVLIVLDEYSDIATDNWLLNVNLPNDEFDILGLIYQSYLHEGKKNITGSYYTPQKITYNMTKNFDFAHGELFLDPCCGSGSFLLSVNALNPNQIFGFDTDKIAVLISKINLLLKYERYNFIPQVYCLDFLNKYSSNQSQLMLDEEYNNYMTCNGECTLCFQLPSPETKYDYIATNPPWGAMNKNSTWVDEISSKETFSCFFVTAFKQLKQNGVIRFLFPEAILNVKVHRDIRKYILDTCGLVGITTYDDMFSGVTTKYIDIECGKNADKKTFNVYSNNKKRTIRFETVRETENLVFNLMSEVDRTIIGIVKEKGLFSLKNSIWALGIVTGNNKKKLHTEYSKNMEKIYTGKEIQPYVLKPAKYYILYDRNDLQQVAKDEIYRAPEKLVYKFISNKLVFCYDNSSSLFLNSANILIPCIPHMSIKTVMAFLNSLLFQFMYMKMFGEVKILKGNLMELPFPKISKTDDEILSAIVDEILSGDSSKYDAIDNHIFSVYNLGDDQRAYIRRVVNGKID